MLWSLWINISLSMHSFENIIGFSKNSGTLKSKINCLKLIIINFCNILIWGYFLLCHIDSSKHHHIYMRSAYKQIVATVKELGFPPQEASQQTDNERSKRLIEVGFQGSNVGYIYVQNMVCLITSHFTQLTLVQAKCVRPAEQT